MSWSKRAVCMAFLCLMLCAAALAQENGALVTPSEPQPTTAPTKEPTPAPVQAIEILLSGNAQLIGNEWQVSIQSPQDQLSFFWAPLEASDAYEIQITDTENQVVYSITGAPANENQPSLTLSASKFAAGTYTMTVNALSQQQVIAQGQIVFVLAQGMGGFPGGGFGGGRPGGAKPSGAMPGGMAEEEQGFQVTPGESFANDHSSGNLDMRLYGTVELSVGEEAATLLQLGIAPDGGTGNFIAVIDGNQLLLTPETPGGTWSVNMLALKTLRRSGIESILLTLGDASIAIAADLQLQGSTYAALSAQGYVSKDYALHVSQDGIHVSVAGRSYRLSEDNELVGGS